MVTSRKFFCIFLLCFACSITGCGPSYEERQTKKEAERKADAKILYDQISKKYDVISFPPEGLGSAAFTYELQRFLTSVAERPVIFKGYLEDIENTDRGIIVEFLCPLGEHLFADKATIRFRLTADEANIKQFLDVTREDPMFYSIRYFDEPDYLVVAKIAELKRTRRYEFFGTVKRDEVEIDVEEPPDLEIEIEIPPSNESTGKLIDAVRISSH